MASSIREIARIAGVSIGTVSLALQGHPRISAQCRERIVAIAWELDYVPSNLGRSLQSGRSGLVGYLLSSIQRSFYSELLQGIGQSLSARGYGLLLAVTSDRPDEEDRQLRLFREKAIDGLIVSNHEHETIPLLERMRTDGMPIVVCDFEPFAPDLPTVAMDEAMAGELLVRHLVELGHVRFAYGCPLNRNGTDRLEAIRSALQKRQLKPPIVTENEPALLQLATTHQERDAPTAFLCYSDDMARRLLHNIQEKGIRCPEAISITGYDDMDFASWPGIGLTTIRQPKQLMGEMAVSMLLAQPGFGMRKNAMGKDGGWRTASRSELEVVQTDPKNLSLSKKTGSETEPKLVSDAPEANVGIVIPELVVRSTTGLCRMQNDLSE